MQKLKIVTIGGGSSYTPELIEGLILRHKQFPVTELWLVDIEEGAEKLSIVTNLARRMVEKAGIDLTIHSTLDRREALKDADFITTQFRVGQLEARYLDEAIPAKHGLVGQETNGAGGFMKALRTIPVIMQIIKDARELAPNAWIINFTNPAGIITEAVLQHGQWERFIGVCNIPYGTEHMVAELLQEDMKDIRIHFAGLNHMVFGLDIFLRGTSIKDQLLHEVLPKHSISMQNIENIPWSLEFLRGLNILPCFYHRYYYQTDQMLDHLLEDYKNNNTRAEVVKTVEHDLFEKYKDLNLRDKPEELALRGGAHYSDTACNLMSGIYNDDHSIQTVNTKNNGAISNLGVHDAVEITSVITKHGPKPIGMGALPDAVHGLVATIKSFEKQTIKAAMSGSYDDALVALVINPLVASERLAKILLQEMLVANEKYLPQFKNVIQTLKS
jgi:6-phospho-beta-glucosidase